MKKKNNNNEIVATYTYPSFPNRGKVEKIREVLKEYRKTARVVAALQWGLFFVSGNFSKYVKLQAIDSMLSERYKQVCLWQVVATLKSFVSNVANRFAEIVFASSLPEKTKRVLLYLNSKEEWLIPKSQKAIWTEKASGKKVKIEYEITGEERFLAKKIFKHILSKWKKPSFKKIALHLDSKVAILECNKHSKSFDYWVKLSTLDRGNPIYIPLKKNTYAELQQGHLLKFCQIIETNNGIKVNLVKELINHKATYIPLTDTLAIDIGLNPLIATNKGDLIGRQFFDFLKAIDSKIVKRQAYVQKNKIPLSQDKKYRNLVQKLRDFLKNEINRYLNRLVNLYKPKKIVIERLDFRNPELSRRLNRLIQNFGKGVFNQKLNRLKELYDIEIEQVNPAYTSQECSCCGYIDKNNRKDTQTFECKACGRKINAQVNGARNISGRASLPEIKLYTPKKHVLRILVKQYLERLKGCNSAPLELLKTNPYFKEFSVIPKPCL